MDRWSVSARAATVSSLTRRHRRRRGAGRTSPGVRLRCRAALADMAVANWERHQQCVCVCATSFQLSPFRLFYLPLKSTSVWKTYSSNTNAINIIFWTTCFAKCFVFLFFPAWKYLPQHSQTHIVTACFKVLNFQLWFKLFFFFLPFTYKMSFLLKGGHSAKQHYRLRLWHNGPAGRSSKGSL